MIKNIRQFFCRHVCSIKSLHKVSEDPRAVEATCVKCGKSLRGHCGLDLKCEWTQEDKGE